MKRSARLPQKVNTWVKRSPLADPVAEPRFSDPQAGDQTRRYWVVAVDALGQEGIPSSPTWNYRTQREFYVPFVGEWHQ